MTQNVNLSNGVTMELLVTEKESGCVTVSQRFVDSEGNFLTKTCTVTCGSKSYSWTCPDNKNCLGDCSDPNNPRGSCY
jgi:hypothetical protein